MPRLEPRVAREQPLGPHPADPAVVLQRAHDARHAEADLGAAAAAGRPASSPAAARARRRARGRPRSRPARARAGPTPAAAPRTPCGRRGRRRAAAARRAGTSPPRRSRSGAPAASTPGTSRIAPQHPLRRRHGQLVALADRARVVAQALEQRGEREHQHDHARADGDRRHRGERSARAPRSRSARRGRAGRRAPPCRRAARHVAAAQDLRRRPARRPPRGPGRGRDDDRHDAEQRERQRREQVAARRALVERGQQLGRRARPRRACRSPARAARPAPPRASPRPPAAPAIRAGVKPSARWTPNALSRRWTSACAPAASIVPAATSATSENATSSEITIPAACESSTRTPSRVTNSSLPSPNETARACVSVTSALLGSLQPQQRDVGGVGREAEPLADRRLGDVDARRGGEREGDVVGRARDADDRQRRRCSRPTRIVSPGCRSHSFASPCSTTTSPARPVGDVAALEDLVAAPARRRPC